MWLNNTQLQVVSWAQASWNVPVKAKNVTFSMQPLTFAVVKNVAGEKLVGNSLHISSSDALGRTFGEFLLTVLPFSLSALRIREFSLGD